MSRHDAMLQPQWVRGEGQEHCHKARPRDLWPQECHKDNGKRKQDIWSARIDLDF